MLLQDRFRVHAPVSQVWALLQDIPRLGACFPGVEGIEPDGPDAYRGSLTVGVGPIQAHFSGRAVILDRQPEAKMTARIEAEDTATQTRVRADFVGHLAGAGEGTELAYTLDVALRGRLAQFGTAVVNATARKMAAEFARRLEEALQQ